jgi:hypothetical protein
VSSNNNSEDYGFVEELLVGIGANEALSSINLLSNSIGVAHAEELVSILRTKQKLTTLCGFRGAETALDLHAGDQRHGQNRRGLSPRLLSDGCAVIIANEINTMGALLVLNLGGNGFKGAEAGKALGDALATHTVLKELKTPLLLWLPYGY